MRSRLSLLRTMSHMIPILSFLMNFTGSTAYPGGMPLDIDSKAMSRYGIQGRTFMATGADIGWAADSHLPKGEWSATTRFGLRPAPHGLALVEDFLQHRG